MMYSQDYDETLVLNNDQTWFEKPAGSGYWYLNTWMSLLQPYMKNYGLWICPSADETSGLGAGYDYSPASPYKDPADPQWGGWVGSIQMAYTLNNFYYYDQTLGALFEQGGIASAASIQDSAGTVFCGDGGWLFKNTNEPGNPGHGTEWDPEQFVNDGYTAVVTTTNPPVFRCNYQGAFIARHNNGLNLTFFDGHSKWLTIKELGKKNAAGNYPYLTKISD